jgi:2-polyprenyl-6-methoxyphenol hydroxylase-like FAD-dependent oxidoreductase
MGLTTGLTDAAALSDALIARISGKAGDEILDEYSDCRRKVFDEVTNPVSQRMKKLVQATPNEVEDLERTYFKKLSEDDAFASEGLMASYKLLTRLSCYQDQDHVKAKPA